MSNQVAPVADVVPESALVRAIREEFQAFRRDMREDMRHLIDENRRLIEDTHRRLTDDILHLLDERLPRRSEPDDERPAGGRAKRAKRSSGAVPRPARESGADE